MERSEIAFRCSAVLSNLFIFNNFMNFPILINPQSYYYYFFMLLTKKLDCLLYVQNLIVLWGWISSTTVMANNSNAD